jgi:hypothetical protein
LLTALTVADGTLKWNPDSTDVEGIPEEALAKLYEEVKQNAEKKAAAPADPLPDILST